MADDLEDEYNAMRGAEGVLSARLNHLRTLRARLGQELIRRGKAERPVSDHAVLRYLERHKSIDIEAVRQELRQIADDATPAKDGEHHWHPSGVILVIGDAGQVITVLSPAQAKMWCGTGRKLANGTRATAPHETLETPTDAPIVSEAKND